LVPLTQWAIVDLSGTYRLFARSVDEKVRLQAVADLACTP
jgi:Fe2+ transport system protein B